MTDYLKEFTHSTAVYIGKLVAPMKKIKEDDDDRAHIDADAANIIHFLNASKGHEYLVDKILKQDQGLTFDVFRDPEGQPPAEDAPAEGEDKPAAGKQEEEKFPRSVFVKEVVREPRMHFFKVPKLGSYLAIRLEYESCLFEEALDAAVVDYVDVRLKQKEQEEEKKSFLDKQKAGGDEEGDADNTVSDGQSTARKWDEIKPEPFKTKKIQFVVCLNTLGQDREFTAD